jgi:hypothetical protein
MPGPEFILASAADVPSSLRGAALLGLVLVGGVLGVAVIVALGWMRRRRASRGSRATRSTSTHTADPWRESGRRVKVDPDEGEPWPPVDPRKPSA